MVNTPLNVGEGKRSTTFYKLQQDKSITIEVHKKGNHMTYTDLESFIMAAAIALFVSFGRRAIGKYIALARKERR